MFNDRVILLFSAETVKDDQLASRLAHDGDPEPIHIEETDTTFAIGWKGRFRIEGPAFIYAGSRYRSGLNHPRLPDA